MRYSLYLALAVGVILTACSKSETTEAPVPPPAPNPTVSTTPALTPATPPPPANTPPPQNVTAVAPTASERGAGEVNGEVSNKDDTYGKALDSEALVRKALMQHVEGKGLPYPTRIEELVEQGTLKSIPPAPGGKKWAIDPATHKLISI